jgi:formylglycine-generating enzyme required for sulfatase activity
LAYEARAGRDDLVLPIYLIDTPMLEAAGQRAADDLASRLHGRQYDDWRPHRFKLQHHETLPRVDELAGAIASAIARNGKAVPAPSDPALPEEVMDRLVALEGALAEVREREAGFREEIDGLKARLDASERAAAEAGKARQAPKAAAVIPSSAKNAGSDGKTHEPLSTFRDGDRFPAMVVIPEGSFFMGSKESEPGSQDNERPRHRVNVRSFAIGKYPVSFDEWHAFVIAGGTDYDPDDRGWGGGQQPVIHVSWEDAKQYTAWLSSETGEDYRLPSEAEWEYAARAFPLPEGLKTTAYAFGDTITKEQANFGNNVDRTTEVGSYPANAWGLHDMHGNVWEWVEDSWHDNYEGAPADGSVWIEGKDSARVVRGGSWYSRPGSLRSAFRNWNPPGIRGNSIGFRLARTLTP